MFTTFSCMFKHGPDPYFSSVNLFQTKLDTNIPWHIVITVLHSYMLLYAA